MTYTSYGPAYNYLWNTGQTTQDLHIQFTNDYSVQVERMDGCSNGVDSIVCIHHYLPALPLMTDNLGIAVNDPGWQYAYYNFCAPDTVQTWFSNLCSSCDITISQQNGTVLFNDTLAHFYNQEAEYYVTIQDDYCVNYGRFEINLDFVLPFDPIQPYMFFVEDPDDNDTITTCADEYLHIHIYDYLTNSDTTFNQFNFQPLVDSNMIATPQVYGYLHIVR